MYSNISYLKILTCAALFLLGITSCSMMHDDLENCSSGVWVKLEVTMDVEYGGKYSAQSFADDLDNIALWVFDQSGTYINKYTEKGEVLKKNDNTMNLPIEPGWYKMVVWTGTEDINYEVPDMIPGISTMEDLKVRVVRDSNNRQGNKLSSLWHGRIEKAEVKKSEYTRLSIELTKNTNTIITVLQASGKSLDSDNYTFEIIAENGYMDYDNNLLPDPPINYNAYLIETAQVSDQNTIRATSDDETSLSVARAELNTLRLMANDNTRFVVTEKSTDIEILNINLTEYLLLTREYYKGSNGKIMPPQAYLDYEDMFRIVFFLSPSGSTYVCTRLSINGWIVRLNDAGL